ncbi:hypothetical protein BKA80DRAFT_268414 [Phyllosticta citrichinensis]
MYVRTYIRPMTCMYVCVHACMRACVGCVYTRRHARLAAMGGARLLFRCGKGCLVGRWPGWLEAGSCALSRGDCRALLHVYL